MQPIHRNYSIPESQRAKKASFHHQPRVRIGAAVFAVLFMSILAVNTLSGSKKDDSDGAVLASSVTHVVKEDSQQKYPANKKTVNTAALQASIAATLKKYKTYDTSVSVVELNSGTVIQAGDSYPFVAASTTKLLTATLFLNNVEAGQDNLKNSINGTPAEQLLMQMINKSDNDAWATMNDSLTKASLTIYAQKQGLTSYDAEKNVLTTNDMAKLMVKLYNGELLNKEHTELLYSWMQNTSEERYIPSVVPDGIKIYHKAGYLSDRIHDVAIIDNGSSPFVIVIYSKSFNNAPYDAATGQALFGEVTKQALTTFK